MVLGNTTDTFDPQNGIKLWPEGQQPVTAKLVGEEGFVDGRVYNVHEAKIYPYPIQQKNAPAVVIFPGGGYERLSMVSEGEQAARWLNGLGVHAFVVKSRLQEFGAPAPLLDAQQAMRWVRENAQTYGVDKNKIGVLGFSAGGHLAASVCQLYDFVDAKYPIKNKTSITAKPDFALLIYPVISMLKPYGHMGSRNALLGNKSSEQAVAQYSLEQKIRDDTPPTFLVHSSADDVVPAENSVLYWQALRAKNIPVEMLIYQQGSHGFGMREEGLAIGEWPERAEQWLRGLLDARR